MSLNLDIDLFKTSCQEHGKPCLLKTEVKDGPNKGKSYLICSNTSMPCRYTKSVRQSHLTCSKHQQTLSIVAPSVREGVHRLYARCSEGKLISKWCSVTTMSHSEPDGEKLAMGNVKPDKQSLRDVNNQVTPQQTSAKPKPLVQKVTPPDQKTTPPPDQKTTPPVVDLTEKSQSVIPAGGDSVKVPIKVYGGNRHNQVKVAREPVQVDVRPKELVVKTRPDSKCFPQIGPITSNPHRHLIERARDPAAAVEHIKNEITKKQNLLTFADKLPDQGYSIQLHIAQLEQVLCHRDTLARSNDSKAFQQPAVPVQTNRGTLLTKAQRLPPHMMRDMYARSAPSTQLYGGRMTDKRLQAVTTITNEALDTLHMQLKSCPPVEKESSDPVNLQIPLMVHQRQALTWLQWREQQKPAGGVLADDMGLGKTLTMISLVMLDKESRSSPQDDSKSQKPQWLNKSESIMLSHGTLIVCMASLVHQWAREIQDRCVKGSLKVEVYHGADREKSLTKLASADVVITTYNLVQREVKLPEALKKDKDEQNKAILEDEVIEGDGGLARIAWRRLILDEAHQIKNFRSPTALSVCRLRALHRWALTGTPIQNDLMDFYSLLRFLRCTPFDEYKLWKKWVDNKEVAGDKRLAILIKSLLLRRTKEQKTSTGEALIPLPEKNVVIHQLELGDYERQLYEQLFKKSRTVLVNYLSSKENDSVAASQQKLNGERIKGDTILLMLLRLRQCCSHPSLTKEELVEEELKGEGVELDIVSALEELAIQDKKKEALVPTAEGGDSAVLESTKIKALLKEMKANISTNGAPTKFVVVSQWTSMLALVAKALTKCGFGHYTIKGDVTPKKRGEMVHDFNTNPGSPPVMLVSLRAGGTGLNLIGASRLYVLDLHWNPALEQQACDRIYRVGQKNNVVIHKFICKNTIETRIFDLQKSKLRIASDALTGSKSVDSKLTLKDLRTLFSISESSKFYPWQKYMYS